MPEDPVTGCQVNAKGIVEVDDCRVEHELSPNGEIRTGHPGYRRERRRHLVGQLVDKAERECAACLDGSAEQNSAPDRGHPCLLNEPMYREAWPGGSGRHGQ